jgi:transposase-like protein
MLVRGVIVSYETIRQWYAKFGPEYAGRLRRRRDGGVHRRPPSMATSVPVM